MRASISSSVALRAPASSTDEVADPERLKLVLAGPDSVLGSSLCAACPYSPAGCCVAPPRYDWSDLARVVVHGGAAWLVEQVAARRLVPVDHGLAIKREKRRVTASREAPRLAKCGFHDGGSGCTIEPTQRPATCNFYLCDAALAEGEHYLAQAARTQHDRLVADFVRWDGLLHERVCTEWPPEERGSLAFFEWLGEAYQRLREAPDWHVNAP